MNNSARFALSEDYFHVHSRADDSFSQNVPDGYTPKALRRAYGFDENYTGDSIKIALVCAFDNVAVENNLQVFSQTFGLPTPKLSVFYYGNRAENTTRAWLVESAIDSQWAHAFAPSAELCLVFSENSTTEKLLLAARFACDELGSDIVSMSFGSDETARDEKFSDFMRDADCIFVSSSGDVGGKVSFPSSSPYCISVGATNLVIGQSGRILSQSAWQNSGGGVSRLFDIPFWQGRFYNIYGLSDGKRAVPDVSMSGSTENGVPAYISSLGGWTTVGGTSLSAACFAGICACIKQRHPELVKSEDMLSFLYQKAGGDGYSLPQYNFYDITMGKSGEYKAEIGWDFATGLGSPVIRRLVL